MDDKWHVLTEDQTDLPNDYRTLFLTLENEEEPEYRYISIGYLNSGRQWYELARYSKFTSEILTAKVIAWRYCNIKPYEETVNEQ